jgi:hypothetical protein
MNQLRPLILVLTSSLMFGLLNSPMIGPVLAQNPDLPACPQTLKQSPAAFLKSQPEDFNNQEAAALHWAGCKGQQNDQRLRGYPQLAARLERLGKLEAEFVTAQRQLATLKNGGGIYNEARFAPTIELHFERLIRLTTGKAGAVTNAIIRSHYVRAKLEVETRIARMIAKPEPYFDAGADQTTTLQTATLQTWKTYALEYQKTYRQILTLIGTRQNAASLEVLGFLNTSLFANEL